MWWKYPYECMCADLFLIFQWILVCLSSFAGGINALAAVTILDVINPLYTKQTGRRQIDPRKMAFLFKGLGEHSVR